MKAAVPSGHKPPPSDYALFACIVATGSLSSAGREFRFSPAMISKRLARMEERLGAQLIRRTTRRIELTETGARFHADVLRILAAIERAEDIVVSGTNKPAGPLRISAPTSFGRLHVAPLIPPFLAAHPRVELVLDLADDFIDLLSGRYDLAIRITATVDNGLDAEWLANSRRILCAAPRYIENHGTPRTLQDMAQHRLLAARGQMPWRLVAANRAMVIDRDSAVGTNSSEVIRELTLSGVGIALRSLWEVGPDLLAGRLVRVLPHVEGATDVGIFAIRPKAGIVSAAVSAFTEMLSASMQPTPPWEL